MHVRQFKALSFAFCFVVVAVSDFFASNAPAAQTAGGRIVELQLADIRSAYLIRAGVVSYDSARMSAAGVREQLQRHFDIVMRLLLRSTPASLEMALDRLESALGEVWSSAQREIWRKYLKAARSTQFRRLAVYRERGLFPFNEGQTKGPVPIFVDRQDTACAVGHLMRLSGWRTDVAEIQQTNNLVFVPDALDSAVARWVLTSGLTLEEAALIQPAYPYRVEFDMSDYGPGGQALVRDGLKYENFQLLAPLFVLLGEVPTAESVGFGVGVGDYFDPPLISSLNPVGTHWIAVGGVDQAFMPRNLDLFVQPFFIDLPVNIRFDVATVEPGAKINQLSQHANYFQGGFYHTSQPGLPGIVPSNGDPFYSMSTKVLDGQNVIASTSFDSKNRAHLYDKQLSTVDFEPRSRLTVETQLIMRNNVGIDAYALDINVIQVPEPLSLLLSLVASIGVMLTCAWRRCIRGPI